VGGAAARLERSCAPMELLSIGLLREYLRFDLCPPAAAPAGACADDVTYDLERVLDDFVLLTFLVGNDFLPHLPCMDIAEGSLDALMQLYRHQLPSWQQQQDDDELGGSGQGAAQGYLTSGVGTIHWERLGSFLACVGTMEPLILRARGAGSKGGGGGRRGGRRHGGSNSAAVAKRVRRHVAALCAEPGQPLPPPPPGSGDLAPVAAATAAGGGAGGRCGVRCVLCGGRFD
jgi:hypothetical protein